MTASLLVRFVRPQKRADYEFLAPALEVLETPPSPVKLALIWAICAFVIVTVTWAYFGHIDIISVSQGKIQPVGKTKIVQPLLPGRVSSPPPVNGTKVSKGQVLIELDPTEAIADTKTVTQNLEAAEAEIERRLVAIEAARRGHYNSQVQWPEQTNIATRTREDRLLAAELRQLETTLEALGAQRAQKEVQQSQLSDTIEAQASLVSTMQERVKMRSLLVDRSAGSMANVIDATQSLKEQQTQLVSLKGQLADALSSIPVINKEIDKANHGFLSDQIEKLGLAERNAEELKQKLSKARSAQRQLTLVSPIDGVVQASAVTSMGQVVTPGQELLRIVPDGEELEVEVYVPNKDIGFVHAGQEAIVKLEAFPFTRYGTLDGVVSRVSTDAVPEVDANRMEGDPTGGRSGSFAGVERVQNLVFPVNIKLRSSFLEADQALVKISPGMAVTVEVRTGRRRLIDYVLSPLSEIRSTALKER